MLTVFDTPDPLIANLDNYVKGFLEYHLARLKTLWR